MPRTVIDELTHFLSEANYLDFHDNPNPTRPHRASTNGGCRFLRATMDEARAIYADRYSSEVLRLTDLHDMNHFRQGVLRREVGGAIDFPKQRDHSAHTLNLYLLGAYICTHATGLREELFKQMAERGIEGSLFEFYQLWPMSSLLHDIGYIFEGAAAPWSAVSYPSQSSIGIELCREYFSHRFWYEARITSPDIQPSVLDRSEQQAVTFQTESSGALLETLRSLGNTSRLWERIRRRIRDHETDLSEDRLPSHTIVTDAFELWREHYTRFGKETMTQRVKQLEQFVIDCMYRGLQGSGVRVLDHGAFGGLLLLRTSTLYYSLWYGLRAADKVSPTFSSEAQKKAIEDFYESSKDNSYGVPEWWWTGLSWAAAATALHNFLQEKVSTRGFPPLSISEDALTYLAIMADILQEWDRFKVEPTSLRDDPPPQGVDCGLEVEGKRVVLYYPEKKASKVIESLDESLMNWSDFVDVRAIADTLYEDGALQLVPVLNWPCHWLARPLNEVLRRIRRRH